MAKETFYFSHDYNARNDPKLQKVLMKLGHTGKGVFWDLIEMLYEQEGYLELSECENYAFALRSDISCINSLINDFDLFQKDATKFWSESVLRRLDRRNEKSKKASDSAKIRWDNANALKSDANALRHESEGNAIKESKVNKNKEKDINIEFDVFWSAYDKKVEIEKCKSKWEKLSNLDREKIMEYIPKYKESQPDKHFRKNPQTFLNNKSWNDELLSPQPPSQFGFVFSKKYHDTLQGKELSEYWKLCRDNGYVAKKDHQGNIIDWVKGVVYEPTIISN